MAIQKKYPVQFAVVCTKTQKNFMKKEAARRRTSMADIVRRALDERYNLVEGEEPEVAEATG